MEAENLKRLQLATAYESMDGFLAYRDLMAWLEDSVEALEMKCAQAQAENKEHFQAYFAEWQQRKVVVAGIRNRMQIQIETKIELEQEALNERPISSDPAFDTSDTTIRGYYS